MKRLTGIIIALLTLCLILSVPAFATESTDEGASETQQPLATPTLVGASLSLEDRVHIWFALYISEDAPADTEYGMIFWTAEKSNESDYTMENAVKDGATIVKGGESHAASVDHPELGTLQVREFDYSVAAKEMTDMVYARGYIKNGDQYTYTDVKPYSVQTYAGNMLGLNPNSTKTENEKLTKVLNALLKYGSATQELFNYRTDDLADAIFDWTTEGLEYTANADGKTCSVSGVSKTFSGTVLNIPKYALDGECAGMKVTGISASAFASNGNITSVTVPYGVETIADKAFYNCGSLTEIKLPSSISSIGSSAFQKCSKIARVYISDLASWCNISFKAGASNPLYTGGDLYINYEIIDGKLEIPDGVETISRYAFYKFVKMTSITIPNSVKNIGSSAFGSCTGLTSIELPNSVQSIGSNAFGDCSKLESINIPSSVTNISGSVFSGCTNLTEITVDAANTVYHSAGNCVIQTKSNTLIAGCANSTIPEDGSVTSIGSSAFYGCSNLTSIAIPNSVTSIGSSAFQKCSKLTSIEIPDGVTKINMYAFYECKNLTSITIPASVTSIGQKALYDCSALKSIYYYGTEAEWATISKSDGWDTGTGEYSLIYLPENGLMVYYENFDSYTENVSDKTEVAQKLGWQILNKDSYGVLNDNASSYAIENKKLKITATADGTSVEYDGYVLIANDDYMVSAGRGDYTIQYDVEYISAGTKGTEYFNLLCNFKDINNFNSVLFRANGTADNEVCCNAVWNDNDVKGSDYDADGTGIKSAVYKITNGEVTNSKTAMLNRSFTIKIQVSKDEGICVYAKDNISEGADFVCISKADKSADGWPYWNSIGAYAICLRARIGIEGYIDNIAIWTGLDDMPTDTSTTAYQAAIAGN